MASRSLGTLTLDLVARIGGFTKGMSQAERAAKESADRINRAFRNLGRGVTAAFAFLTTGVIANAVMRSIEIGDELDKAATKANISGRSMSQLAYAAKTVDVELATLSNSLRVMQSNISEAATGSKSMQLAFAALGLEVKELKALRADEQFEVIADRINRLTSAEDKARAATELFGRAGAELLPLFAQGADGIRKAREEADRLGVTLGDEQIKALSEADASIKRLQSSWEGFKNKMVTEIAPGIAFALDLASGKVFDNDSPEARLRTLRMDLAFFEKNRDVFRARGDEAAVARISERIRALEMDIYSLQTLNDDFAARRSRALSGPVVAPGFEAAAAALKKSSDELQEIIVTSSKIAVDSTEQLYREWERDTQTATETILEEWAEFESKINELVKLGVEGGGISREAGAERMREYAEGVLEEIEPLGKKMTHLLKEETAKISEFQLQAFRNTQDIISDFLDNAFQGQFDNILTSFIRMIDKMVAQALDAQLAQKLFGIEGKGGGWIDTAFNWAAGFFGGGRAGGGPVSAGTLYQVNERGMEAVSIPGQDDYLMMGSRSGQVVAANRIGGRGTVNQTINVRGSVTQKSARQLALDSAQQQRLAGMRLA